LFDAVRDIDLARPGQFGVFLRLFPIALCRLRSGLNSSNPLYLPQLTFSSELGHRDEGDGAKTGLNGARMRACYRRNSALKDIPTARCCCRARSAALRQCPCGVQHNRILHRPTRARRQSRNGTRLRSTAAGTTARSREAGFSPKKTPVFMVASHRPAFIAFKRFLG